MIKQKFGFTLAEVLIVIGIIGVVAALTLPNLNHATGDKETVTKVKKVYSNLTEAVDMAQAIYGPFDTWFKDLSTKAEKSERFAKRVTEFLKVSKDCGFDDGCFSTSPLLFYGEAFADNENFILSPDCYKVLLYDGISVAFDYQKIRVDIDGPNKGKNQEYIDIFDFTIRWKDGICNDPVNQLIPSACISSWTGDKYWYETAWVIENGNLDYLKTDDDGLCPDGKTLNWETKTSCE